MTSNERVVMCVTLTLCFVIIGMVGALVVAIFDPDVPNDKIFEIIGPAFQTVVGGFIGLITGIKIGQSAEPKQEEPSDVS
jgi:hypothetical protein